MGCGQSARVGPELPAPQEHNILLLGAVLRCPFVLCCAKFCVSSHVCRYLLFVALFGSISDTKHNAGAKGAGKTTLIKHLQLLHRQYDSPVERQAQTHIVRSSVTAHLLSIIHDLRDIIAVRKHDGTLGLDKVRFVLFYVVLCFVFCQP